MLEQGEMTRWLARVMAEADAIRARVGGFEREDDPVAREEATYRAAAALVAYERALPAEPVALATEPCTEPAIETLEGLL
jgi:hypothetical protein